jgi:hypothetical protein
VLLRVSARPGTTRPVGGSPTARRRRCGCWRVATGGRRAHRLLALFPAPRTRRWSNWLAKIRWRIEHDYRELKTALGLDHFEAAPSPADTGTSPWSPPRCCSSPCCGPAQSGCASLSLYAVLHKLQALLASWTGTCSICGRPADTHARAPT